VTIVAEVMDGMKLVSGGIQNIRTILSANEDGRDYLQSRHPNVKDDVIAMCKEMQKTTQAVAAASAIVTHFRFTVVGQAVEMEPARFNEHFMKHKAQAVAVTRQLNSLRGRCGIIRDHANNLNEEAKRANLMGLFKLFGFDSRERELQLVEALQRIYDDEMQYHSNVYAMGRTLQVTLDDIHSKLGPGGSMDPRNVPKAAQALGEYAELFSKLESDANYAALQLQETINDLDR
jgi:hypothetical protein